MVRKWIGPAIKKPGSLRRQLGVPQGQKIPTTRLRSIKSGLTALAKKGKLTKPRLTLLRRVNLALTLRGPKVGRR